MNKSKLQTGIRFGKSVAGSVIFFMLFVLAVFLFGRVEGEELSPLTFQLRTFSYYQVPLLRLQIWPVSFTARPNDLSKHLGAQKLLGSSTSPGRWDIVSMTETGRGKVRGDAAILASYLHQPAAGSTESWLEWSTDHAALAQELWPLVARAAREKVYFLVPELLDAARRAKSPAELAAGLRRTLVVELQKLAAAEQQRGDATRAGVLQSWAQEYTTPL